MPKNNKNQIQQTKNRVIENENLQLIKTFDTFDKTDGTKDVCLCESPEGKKIILRIGEVRPPTFFPNGFMGEYIVIPKIYKNDLDSDPPYELEEFLEGSLVSDIDKKGSAEGQIDFKILDKLLSAFWEWQVIGKDLELEPKYSADKINKRFEKSKHLINNPKATQKIINSSKDFWNDPYPSKWKFAPDNLIMTPDNKVGFIDNAKVGLRYFGYDLGMLIWPRWVEMKTENYAKVDKQVKYLEKFKELVLQKAPPDLEIVNNFEKCFWLMVFEKLIGTIYDVARQVGHLADWGMGPDDPPLRKDKHLAFLNFLLDVVINNKIQ